jgi:WD40 repeat protein
VGYTHLQCCESHEKMVCFCFFHLFFQSRCWKDVSDCNHCVLASDTLLLVASSTGVLHGVDTRKGGVVTSVDCLFSDQLSTEVLNQVLIVGENAFVCDDNGCVIKIAQFRGLERTKSVFGERHSSLCTSIAAARSELLSVGTDCVLKHWSANDKLLKSQTITIEQQSDSATLANPPHLLCVAADTRGRTAAIASGDGRVLLWDCVKRKLLPSIKFHTYSTSHVSWPTNELLLSCGNDMRAAIWQIDSRKPKSSNLKNPKLTFDLKGKPNWSCSSQTDAFFAIGENLLQFSIK